MWYGDDNNPDGSQSSETKTDAATDERRPRRRGFAAMDRDRVREIASKGGKAAHSAGTAHQFSSEEARVAGRKGGMAPHVRRGGVRRRSSEPSSVPRGAANPGHPHAEHGGDGR
ncbi:MAG: KGG domain-containing protein [Polyangiaceae bacterium]|nr:KGG domain-containing protein [Polyangiaceae bacterium]